MCHYKCHVHTTASSAWTGVSIIILCISTLESVGPIAPPCGVPNSTSAASLLLILYRQRMQIRYQDNLLYDNRVPFAPKSISCSSITSLLAKSKVVLRSMNANLFAFCQMKSSVEQVWALLPGKKKTIKVRSGFISSLLLQRIQINSVQDCALACCQGYRS